ncbi:MAG: hypothetical protein K6C36_05050 [Clostridia bacterium]|nr:hypothetical protein [Clostridia bacterium]
MNEWIYFALALFAAALCAAAGVFAHKQFKDNLPARLACVAAAVLSLCIVSELFVFNWKHFLSAKYASLPSGSEESSETADDGAITVTYTFDGSPVKNMFINAQSTYDGKDHNVPSRKEFGYTGDNEPINVQVTAYDSANVKGVTFSKRTVLKDVEASHYIFFNLTDSVSKVVVKLTGPQSYIKPDLLGIGFNKNTPLSLNFFRLFALFAFLFSCYLFRPASRVWKRTFFRTRLKRLLAAAFAALLTLGAIGATMLFNGTEANQEASHHGQYQELAKAFKSGKLDLGDAPEFLSELEDPYDYGARQGNAYRWDTAYFEGKYYVYFGVVPCVLLYLPYYVITGHNLPNVAAYFCFAALFVAGFFALAILFRRKYAKNVPFSVMMAFTAPAAYLSTVFLSKHADLYCIPIISALAFAVTGLAFWLASVRDVPAPSVSEGTDAPEMAKGRKLSRFGVDPVLVCLGSLCMALVAGCRPQVFLSAALAVPIFWKSVFGNRTLFSKKGLLPTVLALAPMAVVAAGLMWYNYARFGSPFDFGANYNLTNNDMTVRGFKVGRIGSALFAYFLELPDTSIGFPFIRYTTFTDSSYQGTVIYFATFGSVFALPYTMPALLGLTPKGFRAMKKRRFAVPFLICLVGSVVIAVADAQMAGILSRYYADMLFLVLFASAFAACALYDEMSPKARRTAGSAAYVMCIVTVICCLALLCVDDISSAKLYRPQYYYSAAHAVSFWL